jgi:DnaJ-class molecular chaperone
MRNTAQHASGQEAHSTDDEPAECPVCEGTGLTAPRRPGSDDDARCPVCDGYGVVPRPAFADPG